MVRANDKRDRLIAAAKTLIHQQGYCDTSLADIAHTSHVPLGGVYYYFKAKHDLARAVIEEHRRDVRSLLDECTRSCNEPRARLRCLIVARADFAEATARHGCPIGGLCQELSKCSPALSTSARSIIDMELNWLTSQLHAIGVAGPGHLARHMLVRFQGASLLAHSLGDAEVFRQELKNLQAWIDAL